MICAVCGEREAAVFLRRSSAGADAELELCEICAQSRGIGAGRGWLELRFDTLLGEAIVSQQTSSCCPLCGSLAENISKGQIGCSRCVDIFRNDIRRRRRSLSDKSGIGIAGIARTNKQLEIIEGLGEQNAFLDPFTSLDHLKKKNFLQSDTTFDVVLETRVMIARNFRDLPFPGSPRFSSEKAKTSVALVLSRLKHSENQTIEELSPDLRRSLVERGIISSSFASTSEASSCHCVSTKSEAWLITGNENDHLSAKAAFPGFAIKKASAFADFSSLRLEEAMSEIAGGVALDEEFGLLSARPELIGSCMTMSMHFHLPALARSGLLERCIRPLIASGWDLKGTYGANGGSTGDLFVLSAECPGTELPSHLAKKLEIAASRLAASEREARAEYGNSRWESLVDEAGRALGMFSQARFISEYEAADWLSSLRFAALCGLIDGLNAFNIGMLLDSTGLATLELLAKHLGSFPREQAILDAKHGHRLTDRLRCILLKKCSEGAHLSKRADDSDRWIVR